MSAPTEVRNLRAAVHGRYLLRPSSSAEPAPLLIGFHGYGENAERHMDAILEIPGVSDWHVVAIQGLHPFYRTRTGEVVATWMTKLDRELAIADNVAYVAAVIGTLEKELSPAKPTVLVGFSQGTAMAYRVAALGEHPCQGLIALAGDMPAELTRVEWPALPRVLIGRGTADEWYDESKMERDRELLDSAGITPETSVFEGGHEWTAEFNSACGVFLRRFGAES